MEVQTAVENGQLSFGHAKALLALPSEDEILTVALNAMVLDLSVRQTERRVQEMLNPEKKEKPEKAVPPVDPNVREAQEQLQRSLGLKVRIEDKNGKGRVIIEYSGVDDFDTILAALVTNL